MLSFEPLKNANNFLILAVSKPMRLNAMFKRDFEVHLCINDEFQFNALFIFLNIVLVPPSHVILVYGVHKRLRIKKYIIEFVNLQFLYFTT